MPPAGLLAGWPADQGVRHSCAGRGDRMSFRSGGGERVVAEFGQDVAGLPDDLACFRQGGAVAVCE